jgi:hypothetical protein
MLITIDVGNLSFNEGLAGAAKMSVSITSRVLPLADLVAFNALQGLPVKKPFERFPDRRFAASVGTRVKDKLCIEVNGLLVVEASESCDSYSIQSHR